MLPASKNDFPKCLYLDQNKWIDLSRAHYGMQTGEPFKGALRAVLTATAAGKLLVPFSVVNVVEGLISTNADRRERLIKFMVELSGNRTIVSDWKACQWEFKNAIARLGGQGVTMAVRPHAVQDGVTHALDLPFQVFLPSPELMAQMSVDCLLHLGRQREMIDKSLAGESGAISIFEQDQTRLRGLNLEQRRELEFEELFSGRGAYHSPMTRALQEVGLTWQAFREMIPSAQDAMSFLADIPNLDVLLTLRLARDRDQARRIDHTDIRDLDWLSVAVPYSNIVVSEKYWGRKVVATGLDRKYGTVLLTDLRQLPERLQELGCIG